jgi:hypothetical protein
MPFVKRFSRRMDDIHDCGCRVLDTVLCLMWLLVVVDFLDLAMLILVVAGMHLP